MDELINQLPSMIEELDDAIASIDNVLTILYDNGSLTDAWQEESDRISRDMSYLSGDLWTFAAMLSKDVPGKPDIPNDYPLSAA